LGVGGGGGGGQQRKGVIHIGGSASRLQSAQRHHRTGDAIQVQQSRFPGTWWGGPPTVGWDALDGRWGKGGGGACPAVQLRSPSRPNPCFAPQWRKRTPTEQHTGRTGKNTRTTRWAPCPTQPMERGAHPTMAVSPNAKCAAQAKAPRCGCCWHSGWPCCKMGLAVGRGWVPPRLPLLARHHPPPLLPRPAPGLPPPRGSGSGSRG
jgi:hypothetical protein